jgi:hypothetical protein
MIAEIIPSNYDVAGKPTTSVTRKRQRFFHRTFPMGRYISQPLSIQCSNIRELRQFLRQCEYMSDEEQFNKKDYWMPPEEFEKRKKGDCDDFALWTWRQFLSMGYKARYVIGVTRKYRVGHAWVTIEKDGKHFIVEPQAWMYGETLPRLSFVSYEPKGSVEWDGKRLRYFIHERPESSVPILELVLLVGEWLKFWGWFWLRVPVGLCLLPYFLLRKFLQNRGEVEA